MKNLEMIIRKETKRGARFYKYGSCSTRLFPVKKVDVELMMAEGTIEIVDAEGNVIWSPAVEEVVEEVAVETVEVEETEEMKAEFEIAENLIGFVKKYKDMAFYSEAQVHYVRYKKAGGTRIIIHLEHPERYEELLEEEVDETVLDCTGINFNNINDIHKIVDTETLPEVIQGFIQSCTRFAFDQNTLILYRERKAVASASFFVAGGIAHILDMGAGDVFQWDSIKGFEESQPIDLEEGSDDMEVKKVVKAIQIIKEEYELGVDKKDIKDLYDRAIQLYGNVIEDNIPKYIKDFIK